MKILGAIIALALLVPLGGIAAPANDNENAALMSGIEFYESHTGQNVDVEDVRVVAAQDFDLPAGATGVVASFNTVTGVLEVEPISAMPDTSGQAGCVLNSQFQGFGYQVSPIGIGDFSSGCPYSGNHPGGVNSIRMACINSQYCYDIVVGNGFFQLLCQFNTVTVASVDPVTGAFTSLGNGFCQVFAFIFQPAAQWGSYIAYNFVSPPTAPTVGLTNW